MYNECIENLRRTTKIPVQFLKTNKSFCDEIRDSLKKLYDFGKDEEIKTIKSNALHKLIIEDFDLEQIWQQIELQNDSTMASLLTTVSKLVAGTSRFSFNNQVSLSEDGISVNQRIENNSEELNSEDDTDDENDESRLQEVDLEDVLTTDDDEGVENKAGKNMKSCIVDDKFFKLAEMEKFLEMEEKKMNDPDSGNDSDDTSESEESVDLFEPGTNYNEEDDGNNDDVKVKGIKYEDFFGIKRNIFTKVASDDENPQSSFELRQSRLDKKIEKIEEEAVEDKSWQLKGEITAENRPQNSLLEEIVEFDSTTRPAPIMTEQTSMQLEDVIKQRIKDRTFDSVERKVKTVETPHDYKKKLVLDQEKSKESLAQIYEKEFLKQQAFPNKAVSEIEEKEQPELHQEINMMMQNLFIKLDALSNFHFTPKPAIPELKVVSNLPAVSLEDVAPVATSDAALLAPEEIKTKTRGDLMGKNERTVTDKKRERRKKKLIQKIHAKKKQKKEDFSQNMNLQTDGNKKNKKGLKKSNKINESATSESVKSSKAFFTQLQEQVQSHVKRKSSVQQSRGDDRAYTAKKIQIVMFY